MSDRLKAFLNFSWLRWKDMGDGTVAPVVAASSVSMIQADNGETFPRDSETSYEYDSSGLNIQRVTKTTSDGRVYVQDWEWNGASLGHVSGWKRL